MKTVAPTIAVALLLTACLSDRTPTEQGVESIWSADLVADPAFETVRSQAIAISPAPAQTGQTGGTLARAGILTGAEEGGEHPWFLREGTCDGGGAIVDDPDLYPALMPGPEGSGPGSPPTQDVREANLAAVELAREADYHVTIHAAPDDLETLVACGNLRIR